jgi:hypothetical protein
MQSHSGRTHHAIVIRHHTKRRIYPEIGMAQGNNFSRPGFTLGGNVTDNVRALRVALGSVSKELSMADLAALINQRHKDRQMSATTVMRWEGGVEPDIESIAIMAQLAGVTFEQFARGDPEKRAKPGRRGAAAPRRSTTTTPRTKKKDEG